MLLMEHWPQPKSRHRHPAVPGVLLCVCLVEDHFRVDIHIRDDPASLVYFLC